MSSGDIYLFIVPTLYGSDLSNLSEHYIHNIFSFNTYTGPLVISDKKSV